MYQVSFLNHTTGEAEWKTGIHLYFVQYESNTPIHLKFGIAAKIHLHLKKVSKVFKTPLNIVFVIYGDQGSIAGEIFH